MPEGWNEASAAAYKALDAGDATTALGTFEKYVAGDPDFYPAHLGLADVHSAIAATAPSSERSRRLELAATHYRRAFDLQLAEKPAQPPLSAGKLLNVFDDDGLNRPAEREAISRQLLTHYPADGTTHLQFIDSLLKNGKFGEIAAAVRAANQAVPEPARLNGQIGGLLSLRVLIDSASAPAARKLSPSDARTILDAAIGAIDEGLKTAPESAELVQQKSATLGVLARIEPEPRRAAALRKDAADLEKKAEALRAR